MPIAELSREHVAAVNRRRRIVVRYDITGNPADFATDVLLGERLEAWWDAQMSLQDMAGSQTDTIIWWSEGGSEAPFDSAVRPVAPWFVKWVEAGLDMPAMALQQARRRGLEAFYQYAMNGFDVGWDGAKTVPFTIPVKADHPDWVLWPYGPVESGYWNYAQPGVRAYVLEILREITQRYDFDGINLDFARMDVLLPAGRQWELRDHLTELMRSIRGMLLDHERARGRPFLLSAQIPADLVGCHYTGMEIERWIDERLVDMLILGCRSFEADVEAFRRLTAGAGVKLYPCIDAHHASDGYVHPSLEIMRGAAGSWFQQGADGVCTFNFPDRTPQSARRAGTFHENMNESYWSESIRSYREIGSPETLAGTDKVFITERRGGGHWMIPDPEDWSTPRAMYLNANALAQLPKRLPDLPAPSAASDARLRRGPPGQNDWRDGKADTFLFVRVGDDLNAAAQSIDQITIRLLISDPAAADLAGAERLAPVLISTKYRDHYNTPPGKEIVDRIELRLNNLLLPAPTVEDGWLVFAAEPKQFALGKNLVGVWVDGLTLDTPTPMTIEKLEVHVRYK